MLGVETPDMPEHSGKMVALVTIIQAATVERYEKVQISERG